MVRIASVALPGKALPGCGVSGMRVPDSAPFVVKGRVEGCFFAYPAIYPLLAFLVLGILKICGVKKIEPVALKITGFACLATILISYLLKLTN